MALALAVPTAAHAADPTGTLEGWWAICSPDFPRVEVEVAVHGTGGTTTLEASITPPGSSTPDTIVESVPYPDTYWLYLFADGGAGDYRFSIPLAGVHDEVARFPADCYTPFVDVPVDYVFIDPIIWMADNGISRGYDLGNGTYAYDRFGAVKRDQMAAFLYRLAGEPEYTPPPVSPFRDVSTRYVFYKEIAWLYEWGISNGWTVPGGREYRPFEAITRDQMAAFLYRFAGEPPYSLPSSTGFTDVARSRVFAKEIAWLKSTGLANGWSVPGGAEYRPFSSILRDQMAAFLYRFAGTFGE